MPNYTTNLRLEKPLGDEQYNINVFNSNADKIDQFAGQTPARALTADKLTTGAKINGVNFKGDTDIITGAGFYYDTVTYEAGDLAFIYNQDGALELHKSLSAGNIGHNPLTSTGYWEKQDLGGSGGRNVGEIIPSTLPLTDSGLHLLDGTRLSGDGIYKKFVEYIADLYAENPSANYFCTEAQWQASVTQYGVCGKFVYDSVNNTVRLPKITGFIEGSIDVNTLGDIIEAGLPQHVHGISFRIAPTSARYGGRCQLGYDNGEGYYTQRTRTDTGNANGIYGKSNTVQPQSIKVLYYIVVANTQKTEIQVDIDNIATDLNGKADTDLTNCTKPHIVDSYINNSSWYRVYSDGWCEQGGIITPNTTTLNYQITFLKPYIDINYVITLNNTEPDSYSANNNFISNDNMVAAACRTNRKSINGFYLDRVVSDFIINWRACGYIN